MKRSRSPISSTTAVASAARMVTELFESFTFSPAGAAVYQLGPFGTAAKELEEWDLTS